MKENGNPKNGSHYEISLLEYWSVIQRHRRLILAILFGTFFLTALFTFLSPNIYEARTSFYFPLNQKGGGAGNVAQGIMGKEASSFVSALLSGGGPSLQNYTKGILQSRRIADALIDRYKLMEVFHTNSKSMAIRLLQQSTQIKLTPEGIMEVMVSSTNPELAARLANGYVDALRDYTLTSMISIAKKHRLDVEQRMKQLKEKLQAAEADLVAFQTQHKSADLSEEGKTLMRALTELRVEELATEMQLKIAQGTLGQAKAAMAGQIRSASKDPLVSPALPDPVIDTLRQQLADLYVKYSQAKATQTPANPELQSYREQLKNVQATFRQQLKRQLAAQSKGVTDDLLDMQIKVGEQQAKLAAVRDGIKRMEAKFDTYPTAGLEYLRKSRHVKILDALFTFLSTEYEKARLEEAKESPDFQVLDAAIPPDHKVAPHRLHNLLIGLALGVFLGLAAAFLLESFKPKAVVGVSEDGHLRDSERELPEEIRR